MGKPGALDSGGCPPSKNGRRSLWPNARHPFRPFLAGRESKFSEILVQARTLDADLRNWCRAEYAKEEGVFVAEVGMDLNAGQCRLVRQSVFDLLRSLDV